METSLGFSMGAWNGCLQLLLYSSQFSIIITNIFSPLINDD